MEKRKEVVETIEESIDNTVIEVEMSKKVVPIPTHQPPFPQRLVKKIADGKHQCFNNILKKLFVNVPLIEALEQNARLCYVYEGYGEKEEIGEF